MKTSPMATSGSSLINIMNSSGLGRLPWGTPEVTGAHCEVAPSITTRWSRPDR